MFVCLYVPLFHSLPIIQFQIWAQIWNPLAKADVLKLFAHWSGHKQKLFSMKTVFHRCVSVPYVCLSVSLSHMCVCPICMCVRPMCVCLSHVSFLFILQLLCLPSPKAEQKAAGGGLIASVYTRYIVDQCVTCESRSVRARSFAQQSPICFRKVAAEVTTLVMR